jgi:site-specific recombinase XerD
MDEILVRVNAFRDFLQNAKYASTTTDRYAGHVLTFLQSCADAPMLTNNMLGKCLLEHLTSYQSSHGPQKSQTELRAAIRRYFFYITGEKLNLGSDEPIEAWVKDELDGFQFFLRDVVGLAEATIISQCNYVRRFLTYASCRGVRTPCEISVSCVRDFLAVELAHCKPSSRKSIATKIGAYFRYLLFKGVSIDKSVPNLPMSAPVWSLSTLPKTLSDEELDALSASFNRSTPEGVRDYVIFLCMFKLGLRCSEVASLTLEDFDWHRCTILIRQTKTHCDRVLLLVAAVGDAVIEYLRYARQSSAERRLFLSISRRNGVPMSREQVRNVIRRAYTRAGIASVTGTHALWHTRARTLYESGVSLKLIADILGQKSIDTSRVYVNVGIQQLRSVACPWPEVASHE